MASDVSISYSATRQAPALTEAEQGELRTLEGKTRLTPGGKTRLTSAEAYRLGGLKARARSSPGGRQLMENVGAELDARRPRPVSQRQANTAIARQVRTEIERRLAEED
jgi:hypothetical protein